MTRQYQIFGPAMVCVNFGAHVPFVAVPDPAEGRFGLIAGGQFGASITGFSDLGLCVDQINIQPTFRHHDVKTDAFGTDIPIDQQFMLADCTIRTRLVHWDADIMELCLRESTAGGFDPTGTGPAGILANAGSIMGGGCPAAIPGIPFVPASGYHYVSLNILPSPALPNSLPWRFPASYLTKTPVIIPLGTGRSIVDCTWRAIPYSVAGDQDPVVLSGVAAGGSHHDPVTGASLPYLSIQTVITRTDDTSVTPSGSIPPGSIIQNNEQFSIFLWDHTPDAPLQLI